MHKVQSSLRGTPSMAASVHLARVAWWRGARSEINNPVYTILSVYSSIHRVRKAACDGHTIPYEGVLTLCEYEVEHRYNYIQAIATRLNLTHHATEPRSSWEAAVEVGEALGLARAVAGHVPRLHTQNLTASYI